MQEPFVPRSGREPIFVRSEYDIDGNLVWHSHGTTGSANYTRPNMPLSAMALEWGIATAITLALVAISALFIN